MLLRVFWVLELVLPFGTIATSDIIEVVCVTDCRHGESKSVVQVIRDPGIDRGEGPMDRDKVNEADNVPPIVFVLQRTVDIVVRSDYTATKKLDE